MLAWLKTQLYVLNEPEEYYIHLRDLNKNTGFHSVIKKKLIGIGKHLSYVNIRCWANWIFMENQEIILPDLYEYIFDYIQMIRIIIDLLYSQDRGGNYYVWFLWYARTIYLNNNLFEYEEYHIWRVSYRF